MSIDYLPKDIVLHRQPLEWQRQGLQQTATGYGSKLTSPYVVFFKGKRRRVYATCHSNCASHWVVVSGKKMFVGTYSIARSSNLTKNESNIKEKKNEY